MIPHYRLGIVRRNGDIDIHSWSEEKSIYKPGSTGAESTVDIEMTIGNVRNKQSLDLMYLQLIEGVDEEDQYYGWKRYVKYKIGFNMSYKGAIQGEWSDEFTIQGTFNTARSISASIMDVDGNGIPDLVL